MKVLGDILSLVSGEFVVKEGHISVVLAELSLYSGISK